MCMVINQFLSLSNLCDMPRFHCATCSVFTVRLAPDYAGSTILLELTSAERNSVYFLNLEQIFGKPYTGFTCQSSD